MTCYAETTVHTFDRKDALNPDGTMKLGQLRLQCVLGAQHVDHGIPHRTYMPESAGVDAGKVFEWPLP